jgi:hypothetical protein
MAPECQEKNFRGLTMVAIGVNKSADRYLILDEQTRDELASGKFRDQRRGSFGTSRAGDAGRSSGGGQPAVQQTAVQQTAVRQRKALIP